MIKLTWIWRYTSKLSGTKVQLAKDTNTLYLCTAIIDVYVVFQHRLQHLEVPCRLKTVSGLEAAVKARVSSFWRPDLFVLFVSSVVLIRSQNVVATPKWALLNFRRRRARSFKLKSDPQEWARCSTCLRSLLFRRGATSQLLTLVASSRSNARLLMRSRWRVGFMISRTSWFVRKSDKSSEMK